MAQKIWITVGIPGSGKSHRAKTMVRESGGKLKRFNKDDLRAMIDCGVWSSPNEKLVKEVQRQAVSEALDRGYDVIIDDTNLVEATFNYWKDLASTRGIDFEVLDFTDVPLEVCIARDQARPNSVGESVVRKMARQLPRVKTVPIRLPVDNDLPYCIICDIDGTIAHMGDKRGPFDWMKVGVDAPDLHVRAVLSRLIANEEEPPKLFYFSGRDAVCRQESLKWLDGHHFPKDPQTPGDGSTLDYTLVMRTEGDCRSDAIVKMEFYEEHIRGQYNVLCVLDDRPRVIRMWRDLGLLVLQVNDVEF